MGMLGRENEDYPEGIEMASMAMAGPHDHSPRNGYGKYVLRWHQCPRKKAKAMN